MGNAAQYQESYGGGGADYIRHLKYPEQAQRGTGVGTPGNGPGQHGPGHLPGNQVHGWNIHPRVGWVQRCCYRRAKLTLWQSGRVLPAVTKFCGGVRAPVWPQHFRLPAGDGSAAVVHHWMLTCPRRNLDDRDCHCRAQGAAPGRCTTGRGGYQHDADESGKRPEGNGNRSGADGRGT